MLKLNASFSKKVPAEEDYSSKSYHASIEVELSDGLTTEQIQDKIHDTFELVRNSVESEINGEPVNARPNANGNGSTSNQNANTTNGRTNTRNFNGNNGKTNNQPASDKQLKLLFDLGDRNGIRINDLVRDRFEMPSYSHLNKRQCSDLIDELVKLDNKAA